MAAAAGPSDRRPPALQTNRHLPLLLIALGALVANSVVNVFLPNFQGERRVAIHSFESHLHFDCFSLLFVLDVVPVPAQIINWRGGKG